MSRLGKMPDWQRSFVMYGMFACFITGLLYLLGHQFNIQRAMFGTRYILIAHGVAAMLASLALGSVLTFHIKAGYKSKNRWASGFSQLSFLALLYVSGALLYYGPEEIRDAVIDTHWITGLIFSAIFLIHVLAKPRKSSHPFQDETKDLLNQS